MPLVYHCDPRGCMQATTMPPPSHRSPTSQTLILVTSATNVLFLERPPESPVYLVAVQQRWRTGSSSPTCVKSSTISCGPSRTLPRHKSMKLSTDSNPLVSGNFGHWSRRNSTRLASRRFHLAADSYGSREKYSPGSDMSTGLLVPGINIMELHW